LLYKDRVTGLVRQQKRILIIDDEQDIAMILQLNLEDKGFKADSYTDPVTAYENFRGGQYDLVLMDVKMKDDGFQLYQKIRKIDSKVKVCFLTATEYFHEEIRKEHGFEGFDQELFLRKPIEIIDLVHEIRKLLES
jgi:DNA-binding response OmpR family regulator